MERIVILGRGGAGKSTLARRIGETTGARVIILDSIWKPEWNENNVAEFRSLIEAEHAGDHWVSDGNYALATFDIRLPRATMIIWLERSKLSCSWLATLRVFKRGEHHKLSGLLDVLKFIWKFDRINRPRIEAAISIHGPDVPVTSLRTAQDIETFLARLTNECAPHVSRS